MGGLGSFIVFRVKDQNFAYETEKVVETVRVDRVFPVPLAPEFVRGVLNLRNNVIPLIDLRSLLWGEPSEADTAVIVEEDGKTVGLLVDSVSSITDLEEKDLKKVRKKEVEGIKREFIRGMFKREDRVIFLLDLKTVTGKKRTKRKKEPRKVARESLKVTSKKENLKGFVIFPSGKEWFALPVEEVREIIDYPSKVSRVPKAPPYVEGVFLLRDEEMALVSFARAIGLEAGEERRAIVVQVNRTAVALAVEDVKEIRWIEEEGILPMDKEASRGVIALDGGERIVLIMSAADVVRAGEVEDISRGSGKTEDTREVKDMRSFVTFTVGKIEMAIPIEKVKEVIEVESITPMPGAPDHVEGVYNLRNSVIAVSSLPKRLGIEGAEVSNKVVVLEDVPVGFKVTKLKGILRVEEENIQPADQITNVEEKVLEGIIRSEEGGIIFILDPEKVVREEDIKFLKEGAVKDGSEQ